MRMGPACPTAQGEAHWRARPTAEWSLVVAKWAQLPMAHLQGPHRLHSGAPQVSGQTPEAAEVPVRMGWPGQTGLF